jgi:hypothetical protein
MKKNTLLRLLVIFSLMTYAQNALKVLVRSEETKEPLARASVVIATLNKGSFTDGSGLAVFQDLPESLSPLNHLGKEHYRFLTQRVS